MGIFLMKEKINFHNRLWQVERNGFSMYIDGVWGCVQGNRGGTLWREQPHQWRRKKKSTYRKKERRRPLEKEKFWQLASEERERKRENERNERKRKRERVKREWRIWPDHWEAGSTPAPREKMREVIGKVGFLLSVDGCKISSRTIEKEGSNSAAPLEERKVPTELHHWRIGRFQLSRTIEASPKTNFSLRSVHG